MKNIPKQPEPVLLPDSPKEPDLLTQLKAMTIVVADTSDYQTIPFFVPRDATTNPRLIATAAKQPEYMEIIERAVSELDKRSFAGSIEDRAAMARELVSVYFGYRLLSHIPGRVSVEVDANTAIDMNATVVAARRLITEFGRIGIAKTRLLIKIPATWQGIRAAEILEKEGIHCNLTLIFCVEQALACAGAGATVISPFVGRITDWYKKTGGGSYDLPSQDPGVCTVIGIFNHLKSRNSPTAVMGASFRNIDQVCALAGCDLLTVSPALLAELHATYRPLKRQLDASTVKGLKLTHPPVTEAYYYDSLARNNMASQLLNEGIADFIEAQKAVERLLRTRMGV